MATSQNIKSLIQKLKTIERNIGYKRLGDTEAQFMPKKNDSEYEQMRYMALEKLDFIEKKQKELESKSDQRYEVIKIGEEIRTQIRNVGDILEEFGRKVKKLKKKKKMKEYEEQEAVLVKLIEKLRQVDNKSKGGAVVEMTTQIKTLTELKMELMQERPQRDGPTNDREINKEEEDILEQWRKESVKQDKILVEINDGLDILKEQAKQMNVGIENLEKKEEKVENQIEGLEAEIETKNKKLKNLITQYRAPSKFCTDVVLCLVLLGLVGIIINQINK